MPLFAPTPSRVGFLRLTPRLAQAQHHAVGDRHRLCQHHGHHRCSHAADSPKLLRANDNRKHNVHVVVFFIFGGQYRRWADPDCDPPLFLGFLKGVDFMWTVKFMAAPVAFAARLCAAAVFFRR